MKQNLPKEKISMITEIAYNIKVHIYIFIN